jgi:hypothetical protein
VKKAEQPSGGNHWDGQPLLQYKYNFRFSFLILSNNKMAKILQEMRQS